MKLANLGLGCWAFGEDWYWGKQNHNDSVKTIHAALRGNIKHFDTARSYSNGRSEQITGQQLKNKREGVIIATKTTWLPADSIEKYIDISLKRLCTDWIDILYIHWPKQGFDFRPMMAALEKLRSIGKIKYIGVSNFSISDMELLKDSGEIDYYQTGYSLIWRFPEKEIIPFCIDNGMKIVSYSSLAQGILTDKFDINKRFLPTDPRTKLAFFYDDSSKYIESFLRGFRDISEVEEISMSKLALYWSLTRPWMDTVLVGARNRNQIEENIDSLNIQLSPKVILEINELSDELFSKMPVRDNIFNHDPSGRI
ncbi:MAG: aldo/keto reductase [Spirochaetia bacterium]|jgi:myo-inositol catabolism protein IolS|nr:aldo/keto reductase [Spirochaetia bacterium]